MMYSNDRASLREIFFRAWQNHRQQRPLEGVEQTIVGVAQRHPEYHALLDAPDAGKHKDYLPELGESNPFMHMGLHIAIDEQLALDQPGGIRTLYQKLATQFGDAHTAEHVMMECLAQTLTEAQQSGRPPDTTVYLARVERILQQKTPRGL